MFDKQRIKNLLYITHTYTLMYTHTGAHARKFFLTGETAFREAGEIIENKRHSDSFSFISYVS